MNSPLRFSALGMALAYGAASFLVLGLFAAPLWYAWNNTINSGRVAELDSDARRYTAVLDHGGGAALAAAIDASVGGENGHVGRVILLADAAGRPLAGNLPAWPAAFDMAPGPHLGTLVLHGETIKVAYLCRRLPGGLRLLVGNNINRFDKLEHLFIYGLLGGAATLLGIAIAGGLLTRRALLSRVRHIEQATSAIIQGRLSDRLTTPRGNDEVAALTYTVNRMLDQIEHLIVGVRDVSNAIAHDLRTPLSALRYRLEELVVTRLPPELTYAEIEAAIADVDQVLAIFNALIRLAEIDSGARSAGFVDIDADQVAGDMVEFYQPLAELRGTRLSYAGHGPQLARGDPLLLAQAVSNLIDNALKYTPPQGAIAVATDVRDGAIHITVEDNGPGIPYDELDKVLQRFYRSDASRATPGSGLGLSLVAAVARLHEGALTLENCQPGLRARFALGAPKHRA